MRFSTLAVAAFAGLAAAAPAALEERAGTCTSPVQRKEWRNMNVLEKSNFLIAVKCMMAKPSSMKNKYPYSTSRYEDFISIHQEWTPKIHWVGQFLPWHREYLRQFEKALRDECFYLFGLPYWEMSRDAASVAASPIFTDYIGFGDGGVGDVVPELGSSIGNCIGSGLFKSERIGIAQGGVHAPADPPRCIQRAFQQPVVDAWWGADRVAELMAQPHYETFAVKLEGDIEFPDPLQKMGLHTAGHAGVGGDLSDMWTSPSDPLFFLHHSNLDRIWAQWQAASPSRLYEVGNPIAPRGNPFGSWPDAPAGNVTLDFLLTPFRPDGSNADLKVGQIMNIKGKGVAAPSGGVGTLCYEYV